MKKRFLWIRILAFFLIAFVLAGSIGTAPIQAHAMAASRDDGTWLWPLPCAYPDTRDSVVDWAGCMGPYEDCQFGCGVVHWCAAGDHSRYLGHSGLDIGKNVVEGQTPVLASAAGKVVFYGYDSIRGNTMIVEHQYEDGWSYYSYYEHLHSNVANVNDNVVAGQTIARVGRSGDPIYNYQTHLHFSIAFGPSNYVHSIEELEALEYSAYGWLLTNIYAPGRILVNPAATNEITIGGLGSGNLELHKGSVHYTSDPSHVNIGMKGTMVSQDSPWYYSAMPAGPLTQGMNKTEVKWLQQALNIVMGAGLALDGSFGPSTYNAVLAFQSYVGLEADGSFGPVSLDRMLHQLFSRGYMMDGSFHSHVYTVYVSNGDGTHQVKCEVCDYADAEHTRLECSGSVTSCTEEKICEFCEASYGIVKDHVDENSDWLCDDCGDDLGMPEPELPVPEKPYKIVNVVSGVHVYWNAVEGVTQYGVWRSKNGKNGVYEWLGNPKAAHFTDVKAESGTTYYYKITSYDSETKIHSEMSEALGIVFVSTPDITSRVNSSSGIRLGWEKITGATGYAIYRKSYSGSDEWVRVATVKGNATFSWTDTSVKDKNGTNYKYTIRALAGSNRNTLSGCRGAGRSMVRLTGVSVNSMEVTGTGSVKCKWGTTAKADGYEIRFMSGGRVIKSFGIKTYKTGVKTFTGLPSDTEYEVQIRTYKTLSGVGKFYSAWSTKMKVTTE